MQNHGCVKSDKARHRPAPPAAPPAAPEKAVEAIAKVEPAKVVEAKAAVADVVTTTIAEPAVAVAKASSSSPATEMLKAVATDAVEKIKIDENAAEAVTAAVSKDAATDEAAVAALRSAEAGIQGLVQAAETVVKDVAVAAEAAGNAGSAARR